MLGFVFVNSGGGGSNPPDGSSTMGVLPVIIQTLEPGENIINLDANYLIAGIFVSTAERMNIPIDEWYPDAINDPCGQITIIITGATYVDAYILVMVYNLL